PRLQIILGHLGEGLPFNIWRVDNRNAWTKAPPRYPAKKKLGAYLQENFYLTTSGNFRTPTLIDCILEVGADRIMFSTDWQFHNQPAQSHQHQFLTDLWSQVAQETGGRLRVEVFPQNNNVPGSDPQALDMLVSGELEFFTVMGGILGRKVPVAEIQGVPFAFTSHAQVHTANDEKLGE